MYQSTKALKMRTRQLRACIIWTFRLLTLKVTDHSSAEIASSHIKCILNCFVKIVFTKKVYVFTFPFQCQQLSEVEVQLTACSLLYHFSHESDAFFYCLGAPIKSTNIPHI